MGVDVHPNLGQRSDEVGGMPRGGRGLAFDCAQVSDQEELCDYRSVRGLGDDSSGPAALDLNSGGLPEGSVYRLKTKFSKTELELGHRLRRPSDGPCECDLYLTCSKLVTTPECAMRLRRSAACLR